jgi:hypothetical protein
VISGFLPFLYIFASAWKSGSKLSAASGSAVSAIAILCAIVPTGDINHVWLFETKLALGTAAVILSAFFVYRHSVRNPLPRRLPLS